MTATTSRPSPEELAAVARRARWRIIETVTSSKAGHIGGPLSATDLLVALYFAELDIDPADPKKTDRDRFILSKGHSAIGLYSVLALRGYFPEEELATFDHGDSRLQGHPDMLLTPGVDASTGSLGQGLAFGAGIALGAKKLGRDFHTWVMVGDGEIEEGMVWETVLSAPRFGLDNLTLIIDLNGLQQYGWPAGPDDRFDRSEPVGHVDLERVFTGFGWNALSIDGHDFDAILGAFDRVTDDRGVSGRPTVIIANTRKGRGISFTEGTYKWHNGVATDEQLDLARTELLGTTEDAR
ncbi:transketolase [Pseudoclavibacter chungangensis]|uniref:Transketolase n=1 Tax=Pseudoclavibacter chungangensis TaxID=587635 RepID=A0A7J5BUM8_9MICO|nr:transketolase [Pseudoclavibacter chungangensis]KAB1658035.1 transketolase [Pseudoclavibacter chungangensis]NYJ65800.1 transketolase [Pseudoclavibacter chungangensis]